MLRFIKNVIILSLVIAVAAALYMSVCILPQGMIGTVTDLSQNRIVKVFNKQYNFIWQGAAPWLYSVDEIPAAKNISFTASVRITGLEALKESYYSVNVPVNIIFKVDPDKYNELSKYSNGFDGAVTDIKSQLSAELSKEMMKYFYPVYRYNELMAGRDTILRNAASAFQKAIIAQGVSIDRIDFTGQLYVPDMRAYQEGMAHVQDMRLLEKNNEKELKILAGKIERDKLLYERYYGKLLRVSEIIKQNPDVLKYIYIDRMADDVKVVISSDKTGMPEFIDGISEKKPASKRENIDNLR